MDKPLHWDEAMARAVSEIMENTAYCKAKPAPEGQHYQYDVGIGVLLPVYDPIQGRFRLFMDGGLLKDLTASVYGPFLKEIDERIAGDLLGELLNTIAGRFLGEILPPKQSFFLGLPEKAVEAMTEPAGPGLTWRFIVEERHFSLSLDGESVMAAACLSRPPEPER